MEQMDVFTITVGSICMGKSEILGSKLKGFFFSISSAKMYIDCSWKETMARGKMMLNRS